MRIMSRFREQRPSALLYALPLAAMTVCVGAVRLAGHDTWWHLATGWVITQLGTIPRYDIFSFTAFGRPWVNHQWLYQALMWTVYDHLGVAGLVLMKVALFGATTWIAFRTVTYLARSRDLALWATMFLLWGTANRALDRPYLIIMPMLAVYLLILHRYARHGSRWIWALPFLQIIWINCHGGGMLGAIVVFCFAAGETMQALLPRRLGGPEPIGRARIRRLWIAGLACLAACTINPWGADIFTYYFNLSQMSFALSRTLEWLPPLTPKTTDAIPPYLFLVSAAATLFSYALNAKRVRISHLAISAFTVMLLLRGNRFGPEMMIANLPLLALNLSTRYPALSSQRYASSWISAGAATALAATMLIIGVPTSLRSAPVNRMGLAPAKRFAPSRMVDFLEYHDIRGRGFNEMLLGGYLIFRRWPQELVFYDGRSPVFGEELFRQHLEALYLAQNLNSLIYRYEFDYLVFSAQKALNNRRLHQYLWEDPDWHLVYGMDDGYIYLRDVPKFKERIEKLGLKKHPIIEHMKRKGELPKDYQR